MPRRAAALRASALERILEVDGRVRRVEVRLLDRVRSYSRVEGEGVAAGARVITDYIHFLQDGERVRVTRTREMKS
jgi:hypothetical protein